MEWNNHAVLLLEMGRTQDARLLFEHALEALGVEDDRIVRRYVAPTPLHQQQQQQQAPKQAFAGWSKPCFNDDTSSCAANADDQDGVFVYSRAVNIHPVFHDCFFELYAAAILFNLGLVHHIMALHHHENKDGSSSSSSNNNSQQHDYYSESSLLYDYAMNLLLRQQPQHNISSNPSSSLVMLTEKDALRTILFNNTGHIFYSASIRNSEAAIQCFTAVCGLIMDAGSSLTMITSDQQQQQGAAAATGASLDATDVVNLLRNLLVFLPSNMAAASA